MQLPKHADLNEEVTRDAIVTSDEQRPVSVHVFLGQHPDKFIWQSGTARDRDAIGSWKKLLDVATTPHVKWVIPVVTPRRALTAKLHQAASKILNRSI